MAIGSKLAAALGGSLTCHSEGLGKGAEFTFLLPAVQPADGQLPALVGEVAFSSQTRVQAPSPPLLIGRKSQPKSYACRMPSLLSLHDCDHEESGIIGDGHIGGGILGSVRVAEPQFLALSFFSHSWAAPWLLLNAHLLFSPPLPPCAGCPLDHPQTSLVYPERLTVPGIITFESTLGSFKGLPSQGSAGEATAWVTRAKSGKHRLQIREQSVGGSGRTTRASNTPRASDSSGKGKGPVKAQRTQSSSASDAAEALRLQQRADARAARVASRAKSDVSGTASPSAVFLQPAMPAADSPSSLPEAEAERPLERRRRVLVAEDDRTNRLLIRKMLDKFNWEARTCPAASSALFFTCSCATSSATPALVFTLAAAECCTPAHLPEDRS